jgi:beta-N-acetylhexosaminidase
LDAVLTRRRFLGASMAAVAALVAACTPAVPATTSTPRPTMTPTPSPTPRLTPSPTASPSPTTMPLSLRQSAARLLLVGYKGAVFDAASDMARAVRDLGIGGVLLFGRNVKSPEQLLALTTALREAAGDRPFLIAVDQEGGKVARLGPENGFPATPSQAEVGSGTASEARQIGAATGATLAGMAINLNLAPVVDVNVNPTNPSIGALDRSFSSDPTVVTEMATAVIRGLHGAGVMATLKHFPGLGSATGDTDHEFVDVTATWTRNELKPFSQLIASDLPDAVMVASALNGQLDAHYPSTLSAPTHALLREQLGWDGVVVTDDLQAGALRDSYPTADITRLALLAGNDLLLFANMQLYEADVAAATIDAIVGLVEAGTISRDQIDASVARLERMVRRGPG